MQLMSKKGQAVFELANYNENNWMQFHLALVELRIQKELTQFEVAEILGVSQPAISQFEKLTSYPKVESVLSYALAIGAKLNFKVENET